MAAPHVAGVAALIMGASLPVTRNASPGLSDLQVKDIILGSVDKLLALRRKVRTGGRLNAEKALRSVILESQIARKPESEGQRAEDSEPYALSSTPYASASSIQNPVSSIQHSVSNAFPSPANPEVWIPYRLSVASDVTITIRKLSGQVVRIIELGYRPAGIYESKQLAAHWDGRNANGEIAASGIYFYTLEAASGLSGGFAATRKLFIAR